MPVSADRLTIQLGLNGFSFKIELADGTVRDSGRAVFESPLEDLAEIEDSLVALFDGNASVRGRHSAVDVFCDTWKYAMVPSSMFSDGDAQAVLSSLYGAECREDALFCRIPRYDAVIVFSIPSSIVDFIGGVHENVRFYPAVSRLLDKIGEMEANNRMAAYFSGSRMAVAAAEQDRLLLLNTFDAKDDATALYYLLLAARESMLNPGHTSLSLFNAVPDSLPEAVSGFFSDVVAKREGLL